MGRRYDVVMNNSETLKKILLLTLCLVTWNGAAFGESTAQDDKPNRARYLTIPVNGFIGVDTVAGGFERAFKRVSGDPSNRCVVMTFDSVGGSIAQADRIIEVINKTGDRFEKIAVVTRCLGPALGILLTCDRIFIADPQPAGDILEFHRSLSLFLKLLSLLHGRTPLSVLGIRGEYLARQFLDDASRMRANTPLEPSRCCVQASTHSTPATCSR